MSSYQNKSQDLNISCLSLETEFKSKEILIDFFSTLADEFDEEEEISSIVSSLESTVESIEIHTSNIVEIQDAGECEELLSIIQNNIKHSQVLPKPKKQINRPVAIKRPSPVNTLSVVHKPVPKRKSS